MGCSLLDSGLVILINNLQFETETSNKNCSMQLTKEFRCCLLITKNVNSFIQTPCLCTILINAKYCVLNAVNLAHIIFYRALSQLNVDFFSIIRFCAGNGVVRYNPPSDFAVMCPNCMSLCRLKPQNNVPCNCYC